MIHTWGNPWRDSYSRHRRDFNAKYWGPLPSPFDKVRILSPTSNLRSVPRHPKFWTDVNIIFTAAFPKQHNYGSSFNTWTVPTILTSFKPLFLIKVYVEQSTETHHFVFSCVCQHYRSHFISFFPFFLPAFFHSLVSSFSSYLLHPFFPLFSLLLSSVLLL